MESQPRGFRFSPNTAPGTQGESITHLAYHERMFCMPDSKFMSTVLVVGGAGFIGSHVNQALLQRGYRTVVLDNLKRGHRDAALGGEFFQGEMANPVLLEKIFSSYKIDAVLHFAALTDVGESVQEPLKYYKNNVSDSLPLLEMMHRHQVHCFIFSSSAAVYGLPREPLLTEESICLPISPYGYSKWMLERILNDTEKACKIKFCCLRYFNAAGGDPAGVLKYYPRKESNLLPLILDAVQSPSKEIMIYGTDYPTEDGTCIRDYIHVADLATAHVAAMEQLFEGAPSNIYNLGTGKGHSVREVIAAAERIVGCSVGVKEGPRRAGDPPILVANAEKAYHLLKWHPKYPGLDQMVQHAWQARQRESHV